MLSNQEFRGRLMVSICVVSLLIFISSFGFIYLSRTNAKIANEQKKETASKKAVSLTGENKKEEEFSLFFAGDAMLDRYIRDVSEKKGAGFLTEKMTQIFLSPDEIIFNLEGPVTENKSVSQNTVPGEKGHMSFTFDEEMTKTFLKNTHASIVFLGNNHILNFGKEGLAETEDFLKENNISYFGNIKGKSESLVKEISGRKVAFVAFNQFLGESAEYVETEIKKLKKTNDFVVLYAHWGVEYAQTESEQQKKWAHDFVDAGADLVIGSHPHVVQPIEIYKNKAIFYSLGNFVFDQYFSSETTSGLAIVVLAQDSALDVYLYPLSLNNNGSTTLFEDQKKDGLLSWLSENSAVSAELKNSLKDGHFQISGSGL